jgi:hypothetical protein
MFTAFKNASSRWEDGIKMDLRVIGFSWLSIGSSGGLL